MKIEKFVIGQVATNCYLVINEVANEIVIVDPAICPDYLMSHVKNKGYVPKAILLTHGHFDHVMGIDGWLDAYNIPVYHHEEETKVLENPNINLSNMVRENYIFQNGKSLKDGESIEVAGMNFRVIHTPGHTMGGCCYYVEEENVLFSGDTLFYKSIGRTDFPTGDTETLVKSIKEKLFCLPEDVMVYPGHDRETYIGDEKKKNPFV